MRVLGGAWALWASLTASAVVVPPVPAGAGTGAAPLPVGAGQRIDLELQDAEIHEVLRTFAEIGRVNIVAQQGVSGRVTARFRATPWDQALSEILRSLRLDARRDGNVIYVCVSE